MPGEWLRWKLRGHVLHVDTRLLMVLSATSKQFCSPLPTRMSQRDGRVLGVHQLITTLHDLSSDSLI